MFEVGRFYKIIGEGSNIYKLTEIKNNSGYFSHPFVDAGWKTLNDFNLQEVDIIQLISRLKKQIEFYSK